VAVDACEKVDILGNTIENSSIYLFPFIIEYSMIGRQPLDGIVFSGINIVLYF
jgi:Otopetrin